MQCSALVSTNSSREMTLNHCWLWLTVTVETSANIAICRSLLMINTLKFSVGVVTSWKPLRVVLSLSIEKNHYIDRRHVRCWSSRWGSTFTSLLKWTPTASTDKYWQALTFLFARVGKTWIKYPAIIFSFTVRYLQYITYSTFFTVRYLQSATYSTLLTVRYLQYATYSTLLTVRYLQYITYSTLLTVRYLQYVTGLAMHDHIWFRNGRLCFL